MSERKFKCKCGCSEVNKRWFFDNKTYGLFCHACNQLIGLYKIMADTEEVVELIPKRWSKTESKHPFMSDYKTGDD